jgi:signal transduction histidine kinase/ligand-binding sensor domain-containing protein
MALGTALVGMILAWRPCAFALDPSLDVSQYAHTAWRIREGFPNGRINAFAQTSDGYLWLGTELGLLRYNGVKVVLWEPPGQSLPDNYIRSLLVARDGTLWIGTLKGLASWKDGKLMTYKELAGLPADALVEDRQGTLWVGTVGFPNGRLCAIQGGAVECHGEDGSFGGWVESLYEDAAGNLWATADTGLWRWKPGPPKLYPSRNLSGGNHSLIESDDGALLIASRNGIKQLVDGRIKTYSVPGTRELTAAQFLLDHDGGLWIGIAGRGLVHLHLGKADVFTKAEGLSGDNIYSLFEDREGNVWVATQAGLDRFRQLAVTTLDSSEGLSDSLVDAVLADRDGRIWLATLGGLNRLNNGRIVPVSTAARGPDSKAAAFMPSGLFQDDRGRIWVSTRDGFGYLDNNQFVRLSGFSPDAAVRSIVQDSAGNIWIAYNRFALFRVSRNDEVEQIPLTKLGHEDIATALASDSLRGGLWVGFFNGGLVYFEDGQIRASYTAADGLGEGSVNDLKFSSDGALWASTQGGLSRLNNGRIATLSSKNGLPCNAVHWSMEDNAQSVWLYTACGLVRFPRAELDAWAAALDGDKNSKQAVRAAVLTDGVTTTTYAVGLTPKVAKSSDGKLWFVTPGGVSVADPSHLPFNELPPPVHVEQITADHNVSWQNSWGDASSNPRLPALTRDLEIDYAALSFVAPENVRFRYKLEGWDRDWQEVGDRRQAFYSNLPPHNYRFRVIAANNSGVWNEAGTFLDFSIAPAYYQTDWFRLSCVMAFMAMLWGLYRLRLRQLAYEFNMSLEARVSERTRIARDLHDTLLQSFHGLLLRFQTVSNMLPAGDAKQKLESAIDQAAQAITESRDAVQELRRSTVVPHDLAASISVLGQDLATAESTPDPAVLRVTVEGTPRSLHPIVRDEIYRIAGEAMRNAFRHAQAHQIEVEIRYDERQLRLRIRDDGKGMDAKILSGDGRAGHFGLHGMRERAKIVGGQLDVWSERDSGTEVELSVPAPKAYAKPSVSRRSWLSEKLTGTLSGKGTAMK